MKKIHVLEAVSTMPEEFSVDELFEKLLILQKIEEGQRQVRQGQTYSEEEAKKKLEKWLR
ncbi:hypothetical protein [Cesiribacter andamanensis]|uniref:Uncharacterized protein n=1 Tax=Cesiribacter andamanensis AMV16 TaxID=1279009 RepID=M7NUW3_9BACT|nr:hypothetical protein [Cesiribacter andamanensis]EMR02244.1 hypothetical protein ADICEAN_02639 [Cesiribacter andamanensis AMV16]